MRENLQASIEAAENSTKVSGALHTGYTSVEIADPSAVEAKESVENTALGPIRILIVDDDPLIVNALSRMLRKPGNEVRASRDGSHALQLLQSSTFDVILSDIAMPEMDGFQFLDAVRRLDTDIPIVLLTGQPTVSTAARALEVGAFRYIIKPTNSTQLISVISKAACMHRMAEVKKQAAQLLGGKHPQDIDHEKLDREFNECLEGLWMAFQPIVNGHEETTYGYEALMRSNHTALPHPGAILDAAERLGRLDDLGRMVRQLAAAAITDSEESMHFFVNLHVRDLLDNELFNKSAPLTQFADRVVLEVTERASLAEVSNIQEKIAALRQLGYRIAVDDLGAGYAGLTSFALLEPDFVKLDMSLVRDIHLSQTKTKVVRSMIDLAHDMGMLVVGEGVESYHEGKALLALGCDYLQGFHFAKPEEPFVEVSW